MDPKNFLENYCAETDKSTAWSYYLRGNVELNMFYIDSDNIEVPKIPSQISNLLSFLIYVDMNIVFVNFIMCFKFPEMNIFYQEFQQVLMRKIMTNDFARNAWLREWN